MIGSIAERAVRRRMEGLEVGRLGVTHGGDFTEYGPGGAPAADVTIHDDRFFRSLALGGHIGAAESYVRAEWDTDDLTGLVRVFAANREVLDGLETGMAQASKPFLAMLRFLNRNTRRGSRHNIRRHYDLGNDFFSTFLDDTMTYSSGIFADSRTSMREASIAKYDLLCRKLDVGPDDHVVEIGCGWGGFAIHAASTYGCRVTAATISREQKALAEERIRDAGLEDRIDVLLCDYRDLDGTYDKLVSIEMIEAVGHQYLDTFFSTCSRLLEPDGVAGIQAITVLDDWYDPRQRQVDFIKKYIFPGSFIPSLSALRASAARTDLMVERADGLGPHYAETLRRWRLRFEERWDDIAALGFDDQFRRLWRFYFCYCEGGFAEGVLGVNQLTLVKPGVTAPTRREARREEAMT